LAGGGRPPNGQAAKSGSIKGIVSATRRASKVRVIVSLHGLTAGTRYEVTGSRKRCSSTDSARHTIWNVFGKTGTNDDLFGSVRTPRNGSLAKVKSVRVYEAPSGGKLQQLACLARIHADNNNNLAY
jgi:hypothetical protein